MPSSATMLIVGTFALTTASSKHLPGKAEGNHVFLWSFELCQNKEKEQFHFILITQQLISISLSLCQWHLTKTENTNDTDVKCDPFIWESHCVFFYHSWIMFFGEGKNLQRDLLLCSCITLGVWRVRCKSAWGDRWCQCTTRSRTWESCSHVPPCLHGRCSWHFFLPFLTRLGKMIIQA